MNSKSLRVWNGITFVGCGGEVFIGEMRCPFPMILALGSLLLISSLAWGTTVQKWLRYAAGGWPVTCQSRICRSGGRDKVSFSDRSFVLVWRVGKWKSVVARMGEKEARFITTMRSLGYMLAGWAYWSPGGLGFRPLSACLYISPGPLSARHVARCDFDRRVYFGVITFLHHLHLPPSSSSPSINSLLIRFFFWLAGQTWLQKWGFRVVFGHGLFLTHPHTGSMF